MNNPTDTQAAAPSYEIEPGDPYVDHRPVYQRPDPVYTDNCTGWDLFIGVVVVSVAALAAAAVLLALCMAGGGK